MPFKSQAQWQKFAAMVKEGKISKKVFDEYAAASPAFEKLPKHVGDPPAKPAAKPAAAPKAAPAKDPALEHKSLHLHTVAGRKRK